MITNLKIKDYALFESLELPLSTGFTVFTGESGSGKSLIFDALTSLFGGRCSTGNIRQGKDKYTIQATLSLVEHPKAKAYLEEQGFSHSGDEILITKELLRDGKARIKIGDSLASTAHLRELGKTMVEIHSQNEHLILLEKSHQLDFLDRYGNLTSLRSKFKSALLQYRHWKTKCSELEENRKNLEKRREILEFEIEDLESVSPKEGEEESLEKEELLLSHGEKLAENYRILAEEFYEKESSIVKTFPSLLQALQRIAHLLPEKKQILEEWETLYDTLKSWKSWIREEEEELFFSPERLDMVQSRLQDLKRLRKKYQINLEEFLPTLEAKKNELDSLKTIEEDEEFLKIKKDQYLQEMKELGFLLSKSRRNLIASFEEELQKEMHELGLTGGKLQVVLRWEENPDGEMEDGSKVYFLSDMGLDQVEFYFSANPGEKPRPLRKVASGGELSRVVLAIRSVLGKKYPSGHILLLDEIDTGLGGEASEAMAAVLRRLSKTSQILLITHTQQMAAFGNHHVKLEKQTDSGRTVAKAQLLGFEERKRELARMIGGKQLTSSVLKAAGDLLLKKAV